ncbi:hypothetical protein G4D82_07705 [Flavobacterium sp. CYK-4]|uniref:HesA/MoeB/ThiF family protein n=1 Tax=Flavobacterium lotistagni TaxID=2709660 RepID=UPI00140B9038|nr:HesA/MoeB/ThiF family protein [Flavobacterium lotistagni]NHM07102.1 hypothetical protein [Flavobacterium lotistagni]
MKRYEKQIALSEIGTHGQQKLAEAKVLVIGAGGLGCPVLQHLAAAGLGCIGIVDADLVQESNLNRQVLYTVNDIGKPKVMVASEAILKQNPEIKLAVYQCNFTEENAFGIADGYDIIIDCTDNLIARYLINDVALVLKIPMVYASVHRFEGQLSVFNYELGPTYRCLFPENENLNALNCDDSGVLGVLPNTIGILQATEVLKIILGIGSVLSGKLLIYDGLSAQIQTIEIPKNALAVQHGLLRGIDIHQRNSQAVKSVSKIDFMRFLHDDSTIIIDLKETYEEAAIQAENIVNVPIDQLENYLEKYRKDQKIILFCRFGNQSFQAANYLNKKGYTSVFHLENGVATLIQK